MTVASTSESLAESLRDGMLTILKAFDDPAICTVLAQHAARMVAAYEGAGFSRAEAMQLLLHLKVGK